MAKKRQEEVKQSDKYVADSSLIDTMKKVNHPYLSDEDVVAICDGEEFDFKKKVPEKYFNYLLDNRFIKKV